ncbi:serine hydrolase [Flavobacterium praedii]|uniref:serine hydrolase n=1 Tax=Flavobacterium praedii TaxID=3002900 RepID=UPI002481F5B9|nr:serine hydrolase [Flavobacterium praedii]
MIKKHFNSLVIIVFICTITNISNAQNLLKKALTSDNDKIKKVMNNPEAYELQIIYTQIIREKNNKIIFKDYTYNLNKNNYFYPASTVKFPIAVMALEKLNSIPNTSINSQFTIDGNPNKIRFSDEISKIFAVSDNDASNNLFEFIGFDYLNKNMEIKGLKPFRINHRLSTPNSGSKTIKSIALYKDDLSIENFPQYTTEKYNPLQLNKIKKGIGYLDNDTLVKEPFDFSNKNYYPLETLHNTLKRIIFPNNFKKSERFHITEKDREFILFSMQNLPKNAGYDPKEYYDGYCKFFMFGDTKENIPASIKIYNKVGDAYGTLIDCAYIVDSEKNIEFMVSATILVNKDGIFNDNVYEYDEIGLPFLAELGRQLYWLNDKSKLK